MFTGLIEEIGKIKSITNLGGGIKIKVAASKIMEDVKIDDSISINGVCQTAISVGNNEFEVIAIEETLKKTNFNKLKPNQEVNLERAVRLSDRLGGHLVQGHIDCVGYITAITKSKTEHLITISYPLEFAKYIVPVGSICINGVSLTVAKLKSTTFTVAIIPHTWDMTIFKHFKIGDLVNLEFDIIGKYLERLLEPHISSKKENIFSQFLNQPKI